MTKYSVKYSKSAIRDLDRVWDEVFEASRDVDITRKYLEELLDKIDAKADYPRSGSPLYYEDMFTGYYYVSFKKYIAFYRLKEEAIYIDRVLFAACDYMRLLHIKAES